MDVFVVDGQTGATHAVSIDAEGTPAELKQAAHEALGYPSDILLTDMRLSVDDVELAGGAPLGSAAGMLTGCRVGVSLTGERFLEDLHEGRKHLKDVPEWVSAQRDCAIAALHGNANSVSYIHKSLWRDPDFVIAAARVQGYAMWHAHESLLDDDEFVHRLIHCPLGSDRREQLDLSKEFGDDRRPFWWTGCVLA